MYKTSGSDVEEVNEKQRKAIRRGRNAGIFGKRSHLVPVGKSGKATYGVTVLSGGSSKGNDLACSYNSNSQMDECVCCDDHYCSIVNGECVLMSDAYSASCKCDML
jgi:hypothetical protein